MEKPKYTGKKLERIVAKKVLSVKKKLLEKKSLNSGLPSNDKPPKLPKKSIKQRLKERANKIRSRKRLNSPESSFNSDLECGDQKLSNIIDYSYQYINDILPLFKLRKKIEQKYDNTNKLATNNRKQQFKEFANSRGLSFNNPAVRRQFDIMDNSGMFQSNNTTRQRGRNNFLDSSWSSSLI